MPTRTRADLPPKFTRQTRFTTAFNTIEPAGANQPTENHRYTRRPAGIIVVRDVVILANGDEWWRTSSSRPGNPISIRSCGLRRDGVQDALLSEYQSMSKRGRRCRCPTRDRVANKSSNHFLLEFELRFFPSSSWMGPQNDNFSYFAWVGLHIRFVLPTRITPLVDLVITEVRGGPRLRRSQRPLQCAA